MNEIDHHSDGIDHRLLSEWRIDLERTRSAQTVKSYLAELVLICESLGEPLHLASTGRIKESIWRGSPAPNTVRRRLSTLKAFELWCAVEGVTLGWTAQGIEVPRVPRSDPTVIDLVAWRRLSRSIGGDADRLCVGLCLYLGLRRGEVVGLTGGQIADDSIQRLLRKGGHRQTIPAGIVVDAWERTRPDWQAGQWWDGLQAYSSTLGSADPLWPGQGTQFDRGQRLTRLVSRRSASIGVQCSPHVLRHTMATELAKSLPAPIVGSILGHADLSTMTAYVRASGVELRSVLDGL